MKVYLVDIETSPNLGYTWGKWDQSVIAFKKEWELLSFAFKELGTGKTQCLARCDYEDDDSEMSLISAAWDLFESADVLIGHNIDSFDAKKLRAKFIEYGFDPPSPYKTIDTKKIAKSQFAFNSNSLNDLAATLKLGKKASTGGFDLWLGCMADDPKAWAKMKAYNIQDVVLLEKVYERLKAWYPNHPNFGLFKSTEAADDRRRCPVCASTKVQKRGALVLKQRVADRFQCQACAHWFSRPKKAY